MKTKPSQIPKYSSRISHFAGIAVWGIAAFLLLLAPSASAKESSRDRQDSDLLLRPSARSSLAWNAIIVQISPT